MMSTTGRIVAFACLTLVSLGAGLAGGGRGRATCAGAERHGL